MEGICHPTLRRLLLLLLTILITSPTNPATAARPLRPNSDMPIPSTRSIPQLGDIISILTGTTEFTIWAQFLATANISSLPPSATLFAPTDLAVSRSISSDSNRSSMVAYHIATQALSSGQLQQLKIGTRIPTLLPDRMIVVTDTLPGNLTVDGALITHPDLFFDGIVAVHGVGSVLFPTFSDWWQPQDASPASRAEFKRLVDPLCSIRCYLGYLLSFLFAGFAVEEF